MYILIKCLTGSNHRSYDHAVMTSEKNIMCLLLVSLLVKGLGKYLKYLNLSLFKKGHVFSFLFLSLCGVNNKH